MRILLTNDDGVGAPGLVALRRALKGLGTVTVVAPEVQQSAISSALTLYSPVLLQKLAGENSHAEYAVGGTPADSVKLAVRELLDHPPDLVVSGMNPGLNTGANIFYSGTVAGALEGALWGIPAVAVSLQASADPDFRGAAATAVRVLRRILPELRVPGTILNVNIPALPAGAIRGIRFTHPDTTPFTDTFSRRRDPRGRTYFWIKGDPDRLGARRRASDRLWSDDEAVREGFVSVTPLRRDLTDEARLRALAHHDALALAGKGMRISIPGRMGKGVRGKVKVTSNK